MSQSHIEQRLKTLESIVRDLQTRLNREHSPNPQWWQNEVGRFKLDPGFEAVADAGKRYRSRQRKKNNRGRKA